MTVIPGSRTGSLGTGAHAYTQDTSGIPGTGETGDSFGTSVAVGDINGDGKPELFLSAAEENTMTGAVWILPGAPTGPRREAAAWSPPLPWPSPNGRTPSSAATDFSE